VLTAIGDYFFLHGLQQSLLVFSLESVNSSAKTRFAKESDPRFVNWKKLFSRSHDPLQNLRPKNISRNQVGGKLNSAWNSKSITSRYRLHHQRLCQTCTPSSKAMSSAKSVIMILLRSTSSGLSICLRDFSLWDQDFCNENFIIG